MYDETVGTYYNFDSILLGKDKLDEHKKTAESPMFESPFWKVVTTDGNWEQYEENEVAIVCWVHLLGNQGHFWKSQELLLVQDFFEWDKAQNLILACWCSFVLYFHRNSH